MKAHVLLACLLASLARALAAGELADAPSPFLRELDAGPLAWRTLSEATLAAAGRAGRPLCLLLGPSRPSDCSRPELSVLADGAVQAALARSYTSVVVDCDERPDACDVYTTAVTLLEPEASRDGRALWVAATP